MTLKAIGFGFKFCQTFFY